MKNFVHLPAHIESNSSPLEHVDQPTRGGHQKQTATLQVTDLSADVSTAVDYAGTDLGAVGELAGLVVDLGGQLTSWSQDQAERVLLTTATRVARLQQI